MTVTPAARSRTITLLPLVAATMVKVDVVTEMTDVLLSQARVISAAVARLSSKAALI